MSQNVFENSVITYIILFRVWLDHIQYHFSIKGKNSENSKFWTLSNNVLLTASSSLYQHTADCILITEMCTNILLTVSSSLKCVPTY